MADYLSATVDFVGETTRTPKSKALTEPRAAAARAFLKDAMARRNVNQVAYAALAGVSQSQINDFVNEKTQGGLALIEAIADAEKVTIDAVVGRSASSPVPAVPPSASERARIAATLLGYAPDVIEAGILQTTAHEDARSILRRIQRIDAAPPAVGEDAEKTGAIPLSAREILAAATAAKAATSGE